VHDAIEIERRGVPAAVIVTQPFVGAASAMAALDGVPEYAFAVVPHPTADLDADGVAIVAAAALSQVLAIVLAREGD
jgi:hypothetical protein